MDLTYSIRPYFINLSYSVCNCVVGFAVVERRRLPARLIDLK